MRWFWQRRKPTQAESTPEVVPAASRAPVASRSIARSGPMVAERPAVAPEHELSDELLAFARDCLAVQGARVRVEADDLLTATLPDGSRVRYTTSLARARAEEGTTLLIEGSPELTGLLDRTAGETRLIALRLPDEADAVALALAALHPHAGACARCLEAGERGGRPTCATCPLREGRLVVRWASGPEGGRIARLWEARGVELTYVVSCGDRRGRRDEWVRVAVDLDTGRRVEPLTPRQIALAQSEDVPSETDRALGKAMTIARAALGQSVEAATLFLQQRSTDEFRRRVEDVTLTHERMRRETPDLARDIQQALDRELAALRDVYAVDIECRLESACFVSTPMAGVALTMASGAVLAVDVDLGRRAVVPPACAACNEPVAAGTICAAGHVVCAGCAESCVACGTSRCPVCTPAAYAGCSLCHEHVCPDCAAACDICGETYCPEHLWSCVGTGGAEHGRLCLTCAALCVVCQRAHCAEHARTCATCGDALCTEHAVTCATCGDALCETHRARCETCGDPLCATHAGACDSCGATVCARDTFDCPGCGRHLCTCSPAAECASCHAAYCATCRGEAATCPGCRALTPATDGDMPILVAAAQSHDATLPINKKWQVGRNAASTVWAHRAVGKQVIVVIASDGTLVNTYRKGLLERP